MYGAYIRQCSLDFPVIFQTALMRYIEVGTIRAASLPRRKGGVPEIELLKNRLSRWTSNPPDFWLCPLLENTWFHRLRTPFVVKACFCQWYSVAEHNALCAWCVGWRPENGNARGVDRRCVRYRFDATDGRGGDDSAGPDELQLPRHVLLSSRRRTLQTGSRDHCAGAIYRSSSGLRRRPRWPVRLVRAFDVSLYISYDPCYYNAFH